MYLHILEWEWSGRGTRCSAVWGETAPMCREDRGTEPSNELMQTPKPACIKHVPLFAQECTMLTNILGYPSLQPSKKVLRMAINRRWPRGQRASADPLPQPRLRGEPAGKGPRHRPSRSTAQSPADTAGKRAFAEGTTALLKRQKEINSTTIDPLGKILVKWVFTT